MIASLHGVFLAYLLLLLVWNGLAAVRPPPGALRGWELRLLLPLQVLLTAALVADRLQPGQPSLLHHAVLRWAFPAAFVLALGQNVAALVARGPRLTDIPVVLANTGLGACVALAAAQLGGAATGEREGALLYDYSVLQQLLGHPLAYLNTLSWHVPVLLPRRRAESVPGLIGSLVVPALCGFIVLMLVAFHGEAQRVLVRFHLEPRLPAAVRGELQAGVLARPAPGPSGVTPGGLAAWVLPADHDGEGLPADGRTLVVALAAPDRWTLLRPDRERAEAAFLDGAERLARRLRPALLLPFPEPDGEATLALGPDVAPEDWRALHEQARARVLAVSPQTRIAARLAGAGERSHALFTALAASPAPVDVLGPRLLPGGSEKGGPALADATLAAWAAWRSAAQDPPELWILAAGLSPLAYGDWAHARFLEGCLQRASGDPQVRGILFEGWTDRGHTLGLARVDGSLRPGGQRLATLLAAPAGGNR